MHTPAPVTPFKDKLLLYIGYFLFIAAIYVIMDLYVPLKKVTLGESITVAETFTYIELKKKLPFVIIFSLLMARATLKRRAAKQAAATAPKQK